MGLSAFTHAVWCILFILLTVAAFSEAERPRYPRNWRSNITRSQRGTPNFRPTDGRSYAEWKRTSGLTPAAYNETRRLLKEIKEMAGVADDGSIKYGGVILGPSQLRQILEHKHKQRHSRRHKRAFSFDLNLPENADLKWPTNQPIKYMFDGTHTDSHKLLIREGFTSLQTQMCLTFEEVTTQPTGEQYIVIMDEPNEGCVSHVGRQSTTAYPSGQPLSLEMPGCQTEGTVRHEIFHALGMHHEHSRNDREDFVELHYDRMLSSQVFNFEKEEAAFSTNLNTPYDFNSVMHYEAWASTNVGAQDTTTGITGATMVPHDAMRLLGMGQITDASFWDLYLINQLYCSDSCPSPISCLENGYPHPKDCTKCVCPSGVGGTLCDTVATSTASPQCQPTNGGVITTPTDGSETCVQSPNYPNPYVFGNNMVCNWLVQSQVNTVIKARFTVPPKLVAHLTGGCAHWVELKNKADLSLPGYLMCGEETPATAYDQTDEYLTSETNHYVAVFNARFPYHTESNFYTTFQGLTMGKFELCFKEVAAPGCGAGIGVEWGEWTACHLPCGGCGRQRRQRCYPDGATTPQIEKRRCNICPCQQSDGPWKYYWKRGRRIAADHRCCFAFNGLVAGVATPWKPLCRNYRFGGTTTQDFDKGRYCKTGPI